MTISELGLRMTSAEFEVWLAEDTLRSHECPGCGLEPRDMARGLGITKVKCPFCKTEYNRVTHADHGIIKETVPAKE